MLRAMKRSLALLLGLLFACEDGGGLAPGWRDTPAGTGPMVLWDLNADPLPEVPLPNDVATFPDPSSPTGLRINVSMLASTRMERHTREEFDRLDGWGTFGAISIPFDAHVDTRALMERQGGMSSAPFGAEGWPEHAIYVVDLDTGIPVPLDVNGGNFPYVLDSPSNYFRNDPRAGESNLFFETVDEDLDGDGVLDPFEDTDFDGVLDAPNTFDGTRDPDAPYSTVDDVPWFYERETKTLLLKPILPFRPRTRYAVVVTDRLRGEDGEPVRSPFQHVHHVTQYDALAPLPEHFADHPDIYGDLASRGWQGVSFAYVFTTQTIGAQMEAVREGLYGRGTFAELAERFPPDYAPAPMQGGRRCEEVQGGALYVAPGDRFVNALRGAAGPALGLSPSQSETVTESFGNLSHVVALFFDSPYLLGDPKTTGLEDTFQLDPETGEGRVGRETLSMLMFIPKQGARDAEGNPTGPPFPVAFYVHGYGSASAEPLPFAGYLLQHGVAMATLNAEGHGVPIPEALTSLVGSLFEADCLGPAADAFLDGRAEDHDGDGTVDSGVDFWTAYIFHTRDVVRQTVIDHMRAIQLLRSFDGRPARQATFADGPSAPLQYSANVHDYDGSDVAGDFDGDAIPDVGGPDNRYFFTGGSLGGIVSGIAGGAEHALTASAPIVGAGGLVDVAARTDNGGVLRAMHLRIMGPMVIAEPRSQRGDDRSSCDEDEVSLYFMVADRNERGETEFACVPGDVLDEDDVLLVRNLTNDEVRCAGAHSLHNFRVSFPADQGDRLFVEIYEDVAGETDYGSCTFASGPKAPYTTVETWRVGDESCERCARYQRIRWRAGDDLVSPGTGLGRQRQTPDMRRLLFLAQGGLDAADPVNYARYVILEPRGSEDAPAHAKGLFVLNSIGDQNVPVSAGNTYARAAGLLPFMPPDAPDAFADWRAPTWFEDRYPGLQTPNDVLLQYHVIEGVDRMARHPTSFAPDFFLYDVDDVSEGRFRFQPDGRHQSLEDDAVPHPRLDPPLRWTRRSHAVSSPREDVWRPLPGEDVSALLNNYAIPRGVHGFDEIIYDPSVPWDTAQYVINVIARWGSQNATDLRYLTDPEGHQCLEDSSCEFILRGAPD